MRRALIITIAALSFAVALSADAQILPQFFFAKPPAAGCGAGTLSFVFSSACNIITVGVAL